MDTLYWITVVGVVVYLGYRISKVRFCLFHNGCATRAQMERDGIR